MRSRQTKIFTFLTFRTIENYSENVETKKIVQNYHAYFSSHYGKQAGEAKSAWGKEVKLVRVGEIAEGDWNKVVKFHNAMIKAISDGTVR